ncbi:MAG: hypothetical protein SF123_26450 [Chloroflexota bacterium]|nr:hypothetical protein [Chloroflexota bacterium]
MAALDLNNFYCGGYLLLRSDRPDWRAPFGEYLSSGNLISLSSCICRHRLSVFWGWVPGDREAAIRFGISEQQMDDFLEWCTTEYETVLDVPSLFYSVDAARAFVEQFELDRDNLFIIGAALPVEHQKIWLDEEPDNEGFPKRVKQGIAVEPGGTPIGYDVVSYSYHDFSHSWLCSGLEKDMHELFGIRANALGLLATYDDARKVYKWIAEDECKGIRAEPEPYDIWLLLSYPLS